MKKSELKQLIREIVEEVSRQRLNENQTYRWKDGVTISVDWSGKPTEDGWESLGYANDWSESERNKIYTDLKGETPRTVNLSMHKEAVYYPKAKVWYLVDSSG